ncbi:MAG: hypothetical protein LBN43_01830 [Oscillospiraceae bacterium]|nr:hypothetical protein [Oscillospiraceae bacterium]
MNRRKSKSNIWFGVITVVIGVAMIAYLSIYMNQAFQSGIMTVEVSNYTSYDSIKTDGIIARDEEKISDSGSGRFVYTAAQDGKRVAVGEVIAYSYSSYEIWKATERAHQLDETVQALNGMLDARGEISSERLDAALRAAISDLNSEVASKDYRSAKERSEYLLTIAIGASDMPNSMNLLRAERAGIADTGAVSLAAPTSAMFSKSADGFVGYDKLKPANLDALTPDDLVVLFSLKPTVSDAVIGKLIYGQTWYYAASVDERVGADLAMKSGTRVQMLFDGLSEPMTMKIESVSYPLAGKTVVVFSCNYAMREIAEMRIVKAELILNEYTGLKVPRSSLRLERKTADGAELPCVYITAGPYLERKFVTIVDEEDDFYLISDDVYTEDALRRGDMVVISGMNLYDGKIVNN